MSTDHNPVRGAMDAYADAVYDKDLEAFAALYAEGVHVFDSWGQWQYDGIDAWRGMAAGWFSSLGEERVEVRFDAVSSTVGAEFHCRRRGGIRKCRRQLLRNFG